MPDGHPTGPARSAPVRLVWFVVGLACVAVGTLGIILPGLPTTVFFIGAAASFSRSSPRLEAWVLSLPHIGPAVRDYRAGLGMPVKAKRVAITMLVVAVTISAFVLDGWVLPVIVIGAGAIGVGVILRLPTRRDDPIVEPPVRPDQDGRRP